MTEHRVATATNLPPGTIIGSGRYAVGNNGEVFAVTRRCRHLGADLADGTARIPGLGTMFVVLSKIAPLGRGKIERRGKDIFVS